VKKTSEKLIKLNPEIWDPKKIFNKDEFSGYDLGSIYDYARAYLYFHGELPHGIDKNLQKELNTINTMCEFVHFLKPDFALPFTTKPSQLVVNQFLSFKNNDSKKTYTGLSGHDTNLVAWLIRMNITNFDKLMELYENDKFDDIDEDRMCYPPFASNIVWELAKVKTGKNQFLKSDGEEYLVRLIYNNEDLYSCDGEKDKNAGYNFPDGKYEGWCTLDEYIKRSKVIFEDEAGYNNLCQEIKMNQVEYQGFKLSQTTMIN